MPRHRLLPLLPLVFIYLFPICVLAQSQELDSEDLDARIVQIFSRSCTMAGCHSGPQPQMGMSLEPELARAATIGVPSAERPDLLRVHPGNPDSSYLMMKVRGDDDIIGLQMPFAGDELPEEDVEAIAAWISGLTEADAIEAAQVRAPVYAFPGWKIINLPTARLLPRRTLLFLISHRFNPPVSTGYETFFGLDGSGVILLSLGYAISEDLLFVIGRSNVLDNLEAQARYRFLRQGGPRGSPVDLGLLATVNHVTEDLPQIVERTKFALQLSATHAVTPALSLALVPGVLTNPAETVEGEDPLFALGLGGRWNFYRGVSVVAEWAPVLAGFTGTTTLGNRNRFDSWGTGLEIATAGHVFQIVVTNSLGLTTDQYLRGGDLDITKPDVRLGFNIFRMINL